MDNPTCTSGVPPCREYYQGVWEHCEGTASCGIAGFHVVVGGSDGVDVGMGGGGGEDWWSRC